MPDYKVHYSIHTSMDVDDFVSGGDCVVSASDEAAADAAARSWVENNDVHFDPRIDPFIEIHDGWIEEIEGAAEEEE